VEATKQLNTASKGVPVNIFVKNAIVTFPSTVSNYRYSGLNTSMVLASDA
jgi:hypothetical protein